MTPTTTPLAAQVRLEAMLHSWRRLVHLESAALDAGDDARAERLQVRANAVAQAHRRLLAATWAKREPL